MSSDPFDDDLFDNLKTDELTALDAVVVQSTQAQPKRQTTKYHHTVAAPRNPPNPPSQASTRPVPPGPVPRPLNTEPRAGNSGFGWEYGGKRSIEGNVERHIQAIKDRQAYWSHGNAAEESFPDIVVNESGQYGLGSGSEEAEVVDRHARPTVESLVVERKGEVKGAAARRAAIEASASQVLRAQSEERSVPSRPPSIPPVSHAASAAPKFNNNRSLSRSISAGVQVFQRPQQGMLPHRTLAPIPSQSSQSSGSQPPSASQAGATARRTAMELEQERKRREQLEEEVKALREAAERRLREASQPVKVEPRQQDQAEGSADGRYRALQEELWKTKGEASIMRRAKDEAEARHAAAMEKARQQTAEVEARLQEERKEHARQLENTRTQAVLNIHAAHNSAVKVRQASQRRMEPPLSPQANRIASQTPFRGSPTKRESFAETTPFVKSLKGKGKMAPPPPPRFDHFNNAFAAVTPGIGRVKRSRTEALSPGPSPTNSPTRPKTPAGPPAGSPQASPTRSRPFGLSQTPLVDDGAMQIDVADAAWPEQGDEVADELFILEHPNNQRSELLHHLFSHIPTSSLQFDLGFTNETTISRILNFQPPSSQSLPKWHHLCSDLLRSCGDPELPFEIACTAIADAIQAMISEVLALLHEGAADTATLGVLCNLFDLLASSAYSFSAFARATDVTNLIRNTVVGLLHDSGKSAEVDKILQDELHHADSRVRPKLPIKGLKVDWRCEVAEAAASAAEAICLWPDARATWQQAELADTLLALLAPQQSPAVHRVAINLFHMAALCPGNLRPLVSSSELARDVEQPVIDRLARWLMSPSLTDAIQRQSATVKIIRGLMMMSTSDPDAVLLLVERTVLLAALIQLLNREGRKVWGVTLEHVNPTTALAVLVPTLVLFHQLVFPSPLKPIGKVQRRASIQQLGSQSQHSETLHDGMRVDDESTQIADLRTGINLAARLHALSLIKEFNGLQHVFVTALGVLAYGEVDEVDEEDLRWIQYLSQDLLERVIEGPEGDAIYEMYVEDEVEAQPGISGAGAAVPQVVDDDEEFEDDGELEALKDMPREIIDLT